MPCEEEGGSGDDASISPGAPEFARKPPEAREKQGMDSTSGSLERANPADLLNLTF